MSRIADVFRPLQDNGFIAYIPYLCAGDPDKRFTLELMRKLSDSGADIIELGLPFSDPVADGPTIQAAMNRSLAGGFRVRDIFDIISRARREGIEQPVVLMTYYNPVLSFGVDKFCKELAAAGGEALLIVDVPLEESSEVDRFAKASGLDVIRLVAPSTDDSRLEAILGRGSGFVYAVSVSGVTGARDELPESATSLVRRITSRSSLPVALGFGISRPSHVRAAKMAGASAVVEGSALIATYSSLLGNQEEALEAVRKHAEEMKATTRST